MSRLELVCEFTVSGKAASRGSKRPVTSKKTGKTILIDSCKSSYKFMDAVKSSARAAMTGGPIDGPVILYWLCRFARPKCHYNKSGLKPSAPEFHTQKPDISKLVRGVEDSMTGVVFNDDSQIVSYAAGSGKEWTESESCTIIKVFRVK